MTWHEWGARPRRGFSLIELMVGSVVTTIILGAVAMTVLAVQNSFQTESRITVAVEGARTATSFIEQRLRMAGYGVEPRFAFDVGTAGLGPGDGKSNQVLTLAPGLPPSVTDDLALRYRDPAWMRRGIFQGASVRLEKSSDTFGTDLAEGQRVIVACADGTNYLVLQVRAGGVASTANVSANFQPDFTLSSPAMQTSHACLTKTDAQMPMVLLLHEMRVRIMALDGRPFLMAFPTLSNLNTATAVPLAADVESFQVAYVMNRPAPGSEFSSQPAVDAGSNPVNWVLGDLGSKDTERLPNAAAIAPSYEIPYEHATRYNAHPANIRAVRLSITVRSTRPEPNNRRAFQRLDLEDSTEGAASPDGFYRTTITTTVRVPNMLSRASFIPAIDSVSSTDKKPSSLVWGG